MLNMHGLQRKKKDDPIDGMHQLANKLIDEGRPGEAFEMVKVAGLMASDRSLDGQIIMLIAIGAFDIVVLMIYIIGLCLGLD